MDKQKASPPINLTPLQMLAWIATLLFSILPDLLFRELSGSIPTWLFGVKLSLITMFLVLSLFWKPAKDLQAYFLVFLAIFLTQRTWQAVAESSLWRTWFPPFGSGFLVNMLSIQLGRLAVAAAMIGALVIIGFRRQDAFIAFGNLAAPASPMPVVGVDHPTNWRSLGLRLSAYAFLAMLLILAAVSWGSLNLAKATSLLSPLPAIFLLAAMNSFSEEVTYRAALLAPIQRVLGSGQAIWLSAIFFGIGHFYGVPGSFAGVLATGFFGWILARSMVETKGLFWPWLIHLCADIVVFSFLAIGAMQVSGG